MFRTIIHPFILACVAATGLSLAAGGPAIPAITDADWISTGGYPGINGIVSAVAVDSSGNVYAGGSFTAAGTVTARNIAKWDGSAWSDLGGGTDSAVTSLAIDRLGNVYAGGKFHRAGDVPVNHIAKWSGSAWSALGAGVSGGAASVAAVALDKSGNVYAGGNFETAGAVAARNIAKWDGSAWSALGSGLNSPYRQFYGPDAPYVTALVTDTAGNLFAGGWFDTAGGIAAKHIARWNGGAWSGLGSGTNKDVASLAVDKKGNLYASGNFDTAGGNAAKRLAHWNGGAWKALDTLQRSISAIKVALAADNANNLYAVGDYFVAKWQGSAWSTTYSQMISSPSAIAIDNAGNLYVGLGSLILGGLTSGIITWNGSTWRTLGGGTNGPVTSLVSDGSGNLYAGGGFTSICGIPANYMAQWNGSAWSALGSGINDGVACLAIDKAGILYAAGNFDTAGGVAANNIAKWNGKVWSALGSGIKGGGTPYVTSLSVDTSGILYAAGYFNKAGDVTAHNIAKWNGSAWSPLDSGITLCEDCEINDLAADNAGNLYVGGSFSKAGNVSVRNIAKWNGSAWSAPAGTTGFEINVLLADRSGNLYAGGYNNGTYQSVAKWDGSVWSALGKGMDGSVYTLALDSAGNLYAGGYFDMIYKNLDSTGGKIAANRIAKWDGGSWTALGSGLGDEYRSPSAIAFDRSGNLFVGGDFSLAGGKVSPGIARCKVSKVPVQSPWVAHPSSYPAALYPQSGYIRFNLQSAADVACRIYTLGGREVFRASEYFSPGGHTMRINRKGLAQGAYIVHFKAGGESTGWLMDVQR